VKRRTAWVLVGSVAAVSVGAAAVGLVALMLRGGKGLSLGSAQASYLDLRLEGEIPEAPPPTDLGPFADRRPPTLRTLVESLDRAAGDPKVTGAVLRLGGVAEGGWGQMQELRDAIQRFRKGSKKPVVAYVEFCTNKEYYLATGCSKIYAAPTALLYITGLATEVTFLRGTLDKLGVQAQFEGVGKYKNAPNQFTEAGFTAPHKEQMDALLDSFYAQYVDAIALGRTKGKGEVPALLEAGPYDAQEAHAAGLVDALVYPEQVERDLKGAQRITPGRYVRGARGARFLPVPKIAVVYVVGEIASGSSQSGGLTGTVAGSQTISQGIREARDDANVKAIVLRVDSPGGSGTASEAIWHEVEIAKRLKPVIVSMGDVAASGGYYVSMGSDVILADPGTITGSIGVFSGKFSLRGLYEKLGVSAELLTRGSNGDLLSDYTPWSSEERARIHTLMVNFYRDFVRKAAQGRRRSFDDIDAIAQGRVWSGVEAQRVGLVDRLGGLDVALQVAKERGRVPEAEVVVLPEGKTFFETILSRSEEEETRIPGDLRSLLGLTRLFGEGGPVARLPFELQVR
jgi:protease-4